MHESVNPELRSAAREIALLAIHIADPAKRARFTGLCAKSIATLVEGARLADEAFALLPPDRRPKA
jgi:hypothetical protein